MCRRATLFEMSRNDFIAVPARSAAPREGYDWREQLRALSAPTLVIHGERDALPVVVARELSTLLPRTRLTLIPNAGHMPFWEAPVRFFSVVDDFLATRATAPPRRSQ